MMVGLGKILYHLGRLLLGAVFAYAGVVKIADVVGFAGEIGHYQLLPYAWNFLVAATLPYVELLCGLLLVLNRRIQPALLILFALNLVFIAALSSALIRGLDIGCGCFRPEAEHSGVLVIALMRDIGLAGIMAMTWWLRDSTEPEDSAHGF